MSENSNEFYTVEQVAGLLQVHWQTILNYIKSGKIDALKLGKGYRIPKKSLDKFLSENQTKGQLN
jgi:excisionase family DNA binding protein